jgi:hypothetical protein
MPKCKSGYILRDGYTTKTGTKVKPDCIKSTSFYGSKAEDVNKPIIQNMLNRQKEAEKKTAKISPKSCPTGMIRRSAYMRKTNSQTIVPAKCIKEQGSHTGKPGLYNKKTGERIYIILDNEKLGKYGYKDVKNKTSAERHVALDKVYLAMNKNWLSLFRMINYLAVLNKNHPRLHDIFIADRNYIKRKYSNSK